MTKADRIINNTRVAGLTINYLEKMLDAIKELQDRYKKHSSESCCPLCKVAETITQSDVADCKICPWQVLEGLYCGDAATRFCLDNNMEVRNIALLRTSAISDKWIEMRIAKLEIWKRAYRDAIKKLKEADSGKTGQQPS